ncbi:hypothetical protein BDV96DRAFT_46669 [Lophiotrema nucula]|uniref:Uncharacterized protein n=1 Tax=Lophiotrema nucula TaxID=690887 RepID=A0A6A5ZB12_9PLEO|nr:hypothetical protein BDV96DRAFT_46669 [Lophiotrema nucula]
MLLVVLATLLTAVDYEWHTAIMSPRCGIEDRVVWQESHKEHETMMPSITAYGSYLEGLRSRKHGRGFDKKTFMKVLEDIKGPLEVHPYSEIAVVAKLLKYGSFPNAKPAFDAWGQRSLTAGGYLDVVPFMFLNHDAGFEDGFWRSWPQMPRVVKFLLLAGWGLGGIGDCGGLLVVGLMGGRGRCMRWSAGMDERLFVGAEGGSNWLEKYSLIGYRS